jgi:hypothetical protein
MWKLSACDFVSLGLSEKFPIKFCVGSRMPVVGKFYNDYFSDKFGVNREAARIPTL